MWSRRDRGRLRFVWTADSFVQDVSAGAWVHEGLSLFADGHRGHLVGDVVPPVFEAYAGLASGLSADRSCSR